MRNGKAKVRKDLPVCFYFCKCRVLYVESPLLLSHSTKRQTRSLPCLIFSQQSRHHIPSANYPLTAPAKQQQPTSRTPYCPPHDSTIKHAIADPTRRWMRLVFRFRRTSLMTRHQALLPAPGHKSEIRKHVGPRSTKSSGPCQLHPKISASHFQQWCCIM